jgi:hypothetical protein
MRILEGLRDGRGMMVRAIKECSGRATKHLLTTAQLRLLHLKFIAKWENSGAYDWGRVRVPSADLFNLAEGTLASSGGSGSPNPNFPGPERNLQLGCETTHST